MLYHMCETARGATGTLLDQGTTVLPYRCTQYRWHTNCVLQSYPSVLYISATGLLDGLRLHVLSSDVRLLGEATELSQAGSLINNLVCSYCSLECVRFAML